ncbi:hypothetical protein HanRHA438_Chr12g0534871 [Helianthus annuus]|nr:hypothetical protein HanRHA438_Chr12g0534871 [Helianthus annuus]
MAFNNTIEYLDLMDRLNRTQIPDDVVRNLRKFNATIYESDLEKKYGEPLEVIGYYIIFASLCCIIATGFDLVHGFRSKKLWFPVKYFPLNAVTLAGITVAMKLPVDLSGSMPGAVDQVAKIGSIAFINELLTNVIALSVLVITLVVNICIQISTGVVGNIPHKEFDIKLLERVYNTQYQQNEFVWIGIAILNVALLLLLLIILVSSSFAILNSKQIIELKYQEVHEKALIDDLHSTGELLTVEKLHQQVSKYWIMAGSGSPQFISACSVTTTASGLECSTRDDHHVQCSPSKVEYQDCWSLTAVTLTTIAITLPNIEKAKRDSLLKSVRQGLEYVTLVEETLDLNVSIQNAAKILWEEVDFRHKWLGSKLKKNCFSSE